MIHAISLSNYVSPTIEEKKGNAKHARHYIKANILVDNKVEEVFLELSPTQFNTLIKVADDKESEDLNQYKFTAYEYENSYGKNVGITHKVKKDPVSLLD